MVKRRLVLAVVMVSAVTLLAGPGLAAFGSQARADRDRDGDADSSTETSYTEDNDSDGKGNNIVDDGDNRHPSGKDRSVEHGKSGIQGRSESKPDQNGKGPERDFEGTDKPNGLGGIDKIDQDGNNGCGNDDDFEDDNEGHCGGKEPPAPPTIIGGTDDHRDDDSTKSNVQVLGEQGSRPTQVLGVQFARGQALPKTGTDVGPLVVASMMLISIGGVVWLFSHGKIRLSEN